MKRPTCSICGFEYPKDARFCQNCGAPVGPQESPSPPFSEKLLHHLPPPKESSEPLAPPAEDPGRAADGSALPHPDKDRFCSTCGHHNLPGAPFCPICGHTF